MKLVPTSEALATYLHHHASALAGSLNSEQLHALDELRNETQSLSGSEMQISKEQGAFLYLMARLCGAKRILELGRYTGYSTICLAAALPDSGKIISVDRDTRTLSVAEKYFQMTGQASKIDIRTGLATEVLESLKSSSNFDPFDLVFIDADKAPMRDYYEACLTLTRQGGLIILDNTLWSGQVVNEKDQQKSTQAIRDCNSFVTNDPRTESVLLNIADGVLAARKL